MTHPVRTAAVASIALAAAAAVYAVAIERRAYRVRTELMPVLSPGAEPVRILHLSDLHLAPWQRDRIDWLRGLTALKPDLIITTGDLMGHRDALPALTEALMPFDGVPGVFVHGSNDYFAPQLKNPFRYFAGPSKGDGDAVERLDIDALERLLADRLGWRSLNNDVAQLDVNGSTLDFVGVNDAHRGWDRLDALPALLDALREQDDDDSDDPAVTIGVTHAPYRRVLDTFTTQGADAIFAGHTHGGQVCLPGGRALVTNCDLPAEQARGLSLWYHAHRAAYLNVSAGLGHSIYAPVRFACPPEAVVVTLVGDDIGYA
ncbi:putative MPP superfamily phosphohydrolase [Microcella putealis]|uniref:Putative MPP superfamily phosphohydrolase n=1 Tax=Microcella putealis TaxID=337005 RepID=A0A4Q7LHF6_9MICO|nr:metallophosphoesterase [Microcella putealis]RZS53491.1 putative MPP superfamily phosphohydrolase [Microcella putealis]TQM26935.1 putative MPP superfamily phosphohydrolase [Microcella putealis]